MQEIVLRKKESSYANRQLPCKSGFARRLFPQRKINFPEVFMFAVPFTLRDHGAHDLNHGPTGAALWSQPRLRHAKSRASPHYNSSVCYATARSSSNAGRENSSRTKSFAVFSYLLFESRSGGGPVTIMPWALNNRFNQSGCGRFNRIIKSWKWTFLRNGSKRGSTPLNWRFRQ